MTSSWMTWQLCKKIRNCSLIFWGTLFRGPKNRAQKKCSRVTSLFESLKKMVNLFLGSPKRSEIATHYSILNDYKSVNYGATNRTKWSFFSKNNIDTVGAKLSMFAWNEDSISFINKTDRTCKLSE